MEENNTSKWHLSEYNLFASAPIDNLLPCVNLMKGTYSELSSEDILYLYDLNKIKQDSDNFKNLVTQGILVNFNEKELIKSMALRHAIYSDRVKITIAPTLACNFNCPYCFEIHKNRIKMTEEIQDNILNVIKKIMSINKNKILQVTWYGGEPLLEPDTIEELSKKILKYIDDNGITYQSDIITNGYFFTKKNVKMLEEARIFSCQITLDGMKEHHDKSRHLVNGGPTFDKIIENLSTCNYKGNISLRHNINNETEEDAEALKEIVNKLRKENKLNIHYYAAITVNNPGENRKEKIEYLDKEKDARIMAMINARKIGFCKPMFCGAQGFWSLTIDNEGYLYKCWEDIGKLERSFGNVKKWDPRNPYGTTDNIDIFTKYTNSGGIFEESECYDCIWLPQCAGGCASKRIFCNIKCLPYKDNPDIFISEVGKYYKQNKQQNCNCY